MPAKHIAHCESRVTAALDTSPDRIHVTVVRGEGHWPVAQITAKYMVFGGHRRTHQEWREMEAVVVAGLVGPALWGVWSVNRSTLLALCADAANGVYFHNATVQS